MEELKQKNKWIKGSKGKTNWFVWWET
jgi:hypothetical protein